MVNFDQWNGFKGRLWKEEINVRDFVQNNYKMCIRDRYKLCQQNYYDSYE